jgi:pyrrolidone-carboxylate peptidase
MLERLLASQEDMKAMQEQMIAKMKAQQERMVAMIGHLPEKTEPSPEKMGANQEEAEVVAEHYKLGPRLKAVHVLTILQGQASYVLPRAPK